MAIIHDKHEVKKTRARDILICFFFIIFQLCLRMDLIKIIKQHSTQLYKLNVCNWHAIRKFVRWRIRNSMLFMSFNKSSFKITASHLLVEGMRQWRRDILRLGKIIILKLLNLVESSFPLWKTNIVCWFWHLLNCELDFEFIECVFFFLIILTSSPYFVLNSPWLGVRCDSNSKSSTSRDENFYKFLYFPCN